MRNFGFDQKPDPVETQRMPIPPMPARAEHRPPQAQAQPERKVAVLGPTLRFKGELSADEDFILQGRLEGSINHTQSVTIGTDGVVVGDIHARVIVIDGNVEGDLHGAETVIVHETGRVTGNIFAPRVGLVEGSFFSGRIEMGERKATARTSGRAQMPAPGEPLTAEQTQKLLAIRE